MRTIVSIFLSLVLILVELIFAPVFAAQRNPPAAPLPANPILPMRFEENVGQSNRQAQFISRGLGYELFLAPSEAVFMFSDRKAKSQANQNMSSSLEKRFSDEHHVKGMKPSVLRLKIEGASGTPIVTRMDRLPGVSNYIIGNDPSKWRIGVVSYGKVRYSDIYSGIDLIYYGNQGQMECDFVVKAGGDPTQISMALDGAEKVSINSNTGDISIETSTGRVALRKPVIYQMDGGIKKSVHGNYRFKSGGRIVFNVKNYNRALDLVIDPVLSYSTYLGGSDLDWPYGIATDVSGNAYITGSTWSSDFPTVGTSISSGPPTSGSEGFVTKLNASGAAVYSTYIGGTSGVDGEYGIAVDANGFAYVVGGTGSIDFPITSESAYQTSFGSGALGNAVVFVLSADGGSLLYSTYLGGSVSDYGTAITVDALGNAYITGEAWSSDFPTTMNAVQSTLKSANGNGFVARIDTTQAGTNSLIYSTFLGGTTSFGDTGNGIGIDAAKNIYITGNACSPDFPVTLSAFKTAPPSNSCSAFLSEINTTQSGSAGLTYSTYFGGADLSSSSFEQGSALTIDSTGKVYVVGYSSAPDFPTTTGATNGGAGKAFVAKFDTAQSNSASLIYSTLFGSTTTPIGSYNQDVANSVAVDASGRAYISGWTYGTDFPTTPDGIQLTPGSGVTGFLTIVNINASSILNSTYLGGSGASSVYGIALDPSFNIYLAGMTGSADLTTTTGAFQTTLAGSYDGFVTKFNALP